jgi:hypothetical protein
MYLNCSRKDEAEEQGETKVRLFYYPSGISPAYSIDSGTEPAVEVCEFGVVSGQMSASRIRTVYSGTKLSTGEEIKRG